MEFGALGSIPTSSKQYKRSDMRLDTYQLDCALDPAGMKFLDLVNRQYISFCGVVARHFIPSITYGRLEVQDTRRCSFESCHP